MYSCRVSVGLFLCALMGCQGNGTTKAVQDKADTVSGKVYLGEQLVNYGVISFISENAKTINSVIYPDGTYNIRNPSPGEVRIVIVTGQPPIPAAGGGKSGPPPSFKKITIPEKYSDVEKTDLKYQVVEGKHTHDIKMETGK